MIESYRVLTTKQILNGVHQSIIYRVLIDEKAYPKFN